jgi:hypothetical protein
MSNTKKFQYASGDESDTTAFLASAGVRDQREQQQQQQMTTAPETWYTPHDDGRPRFRNNASRVVVLVFSVFLLLAGIAVCIVGRVQQDKKILPLCPHCSQLVTAMYAFGGALIVLSLIGLGSGVTRFKPLAFFFTFLMILLAIAFIAAGFAVVVFETGLKESEVETLWTDAIQDEGSMVCDLQDQLHCSGFNACCGLVNGTTNITIPACNATSGQLQQCDWRCTTSNQQYTEPCNTKVEDEVKSNFKPLIGIAFALAFVMIFVAVAAVRQTLRS